MAVTGLGSNVTAVSAGDIHTCAIQSGALKCWGHSAYGRLGIGFGAPVDETTPTQVVGLTSGVTAISAGKWHTCAVHSGAAKCWGYNADSELGDGTTSPAVSPLQVSGLTFNVTAVAAGGNHSCALQSGVAKCWGDDQAGQLGYGPFGASTPTDVGGMTSGATAISAGLFHTCAIQSGSARCWGSNAEFQVGNGGATIPYGVWGAIDVVGLSASVTAIVSGAFDGCAIQGGALKCWGQDDYGQLGIGGSTWSMSPAQVTGLSQFVTAVASGEAHTCAVHNGVAKCWGKNTDGQLGDGTTANTNTPRTVVLP